MKWELREKYDVQDRQYQAIRDRYDRALIEAGTRLEDLKSEQGALLREEFRTGADMSAQKAKLRAKIDEAEKAKESTALERNQAYDYTRVAAGMDRITVRDLVLDWNGPYRSAVREAELTPVVERISAARSEYYNAVLDFYNLKDRYFSEYNTLHDMAYGDNKNHSGNHMYPHEIANEGDLSTITNEDLIHIQNRRTLPDGIERKEGKS
ncbi:MULTISPECIES: hypothetical protein [unclassified Paenibacillus]|uniref:hypothetical protein n=1 Tax=unclassified Paenibacillus TaxID=185978 RepID=UPI003644FA88